MTTRIRHTYLWLLTALLALTACSADNAGGTDSPTPTPPTKGQLVDVRLHLSVAGQQSGRLQTRADDPNAADEELMNVWTVVGVAEDGKVQFIYACKPGTEEREEDFMVTVPTGTYDFYSFANIAPAKVMELLGISSTTTDSFNPTDNAVHQISFLENTSVSKNNILAKEVQVKGNGFSLSDTDNGFGATGIPMSNLQQKTITESDDVMLVVVRMLAKIKLQLYNESANDIEIVSATLSDITQNANGNLKLLPKLTTGADAKDYVHGDIQPNLGSGVTTADFTHTENITVAKNTQKDSGTSKEITFYVNESTKPTNPYGHFFLTLKIKKGESSYEERYALIDESNQSDTDAGKWDYIARNDYRVIPIVLDDYVLDLIPFDFPPIGVLPCSVKNEDGLFTINFHDYGHFHLVPQVKKASTGATIPYGGTTGDYWTLYTTTDNLANDFANSWSSYDKFGGTAYGDDKTCGGFYVNKTLTRDTPDEEGGGIPVFDNVTTWSNYSPFIFGCIANPPDAWWTADPRTDRSVYHEFRIQLHRDGVTPASREMLAHVYMILDAKQMMDKPARTGNRPARRPHGH